MSKTAAALSRTAQCSWANDVVETLSLCGHFALSGTEVVAVSAARKKGSSNSRQDRALTAIACTHAPTALSSGDPPLGATPLPGTPPPRASATPVRCSTTRCLSSSAAFLSSSWRTHSCRNSMNVSGKVALLALAR